MSERFDNFEDLARLALVKAFEELGTKAERVSAMKGCPVRPRTERGFPLSEAIYILVAPNRGVVEIVFYMDEGARRIPGVTFDQDGEAKINMASFASLIWRRPRLVRRALRRIEAASLWLARVEEACWREWAVWQENTTVAATIEEVRARAAAEALAQRRDP